MERQVSFISVIIVMVLAVSTAQAALVAEVSTLAAYGSNTVVDSDTRFDLAATAEAHAFAYNDDEYAQSDGWATIGGSVKAYSRAGGYRELTITSSVDATQTSEWLITSGTLDLGTTVSVILDVDFDGQLWAVDGIASASASLKLGNNIIYEGSGTRVNHMNSTFDSSGAWAGDFTQSYSYFRLNTTDTISFLAEIGQIIDLSLSLHTETNLPEPIDSGAISDFSDSGSYAFIGAEDPLNPGTMLDVNFEMVPEPATLLLLGIGAILVRRRKQ